MNPHILRTELFCQHLGIRFLGSEERYDQHAIVFKFSDLYGITRWYRVVSMRDFVDARFRYEIIECICEEAAAAINKWIDEHAEVE